MGEKFAANPVSGTGSMSVPIATSPGGPVLGRSFPCPTTPAQATDPLGLAGAFLFRPSRRKTDKGLPRYRDGEESDGFILSGAEDLVPVLVESNGQWQSEMLPLRTVDGKSYRIQRYRPRTRGPVRAD